MRMIGYRLAWMEVHMTHTTVPEEIELERKEYKLSGETYLPDSIQAGIKKLMKIGVLIDEGKN